MLAASRFVPPWLAITLLCACGSSEERKPFDGSGSNDGGATSTGGGAPSSEAGAAEGGARPGDGSIGAACAQKSDCDARLSLDCYTVFQPVPAAGFPGKTFPGGMCSRRCGSPNPESPSPEDQNLSPDCGSGAVCVSSSKSGGQGSYSMEMCLKSCTAERDCRTLEGYRCVEGLFGVKTCQAP